MSETGSLKSLLSRIESEADEEIRKISDSIKEKKEKLEEEFKEKKELFIENEKKKHAVQGELEKTKMISAARLDARKEILQAKRKVIENTFDNMISQIRDLSKKDLRKAAKKILKEMVSSGKEKIITSKDFDIINKEFINELNSSQGWSLSLQSQKELEEGWFHVDGGNYRAVAGPEALKDFFKEKYESKVISRLFKSETKNR